MKIYLSTFLLFISYLSRAQGLYISGKVYDAHSGEKLVGVTCFDIKNKKYLTTNQEGYFNIVSKSSSVTIRFSYVGYASKDTTFFSSGAVAIPLSSGLVLDEVSIRSDRRIDPTFAQISAKQIRQLPGILGERDVIKILAFQPGVMSGTEGSSAIFVRGGGGDQNLVLWDEAVLYNVNHLGGFFSIFNPSVVKNLQLYKSFIPANYGGRGSSVIAISTREGNRHEVEGEVEIGLLNQNFTIEGPIEEGKSSFIVSGRYSNLGVVGLVQSALASNSGDFNNISFYDFSGRVNRQIGKNGQLVYSFFSGADQYRNSEAYDFIREKNVLRWRNTVHSLKYTQTLGKQLFFKTHLARTVYKSTMQFQDEFPDQGFVRQGLNNQITDWSGKLSMDYTLSPALSSSAGVELISHEFRPSYFTQSTGTARSDSGSIVRTVEPSLFVQTSFQPFKKIKFDLGMRYSSLLTPGKTFSNWEPRVQIQLLPTQNRSVFFSFTQMNQYLHSLASTGTGFNLEVWVPAKEDVPPLNVTSLSLGYRQVIGRWSFGQEVYSKNFRNLIMYGEGENISIFQGSDWSNRINKQGTGMSVGLENFVQFVHPKGQIDLAYTWSKTDHRFIGINQSQLFPFRFDRRHYLTAQGSYNLSKKWQVNAAFVLQSGQAFTSPTGVRPNGDMNYISPIFYYTSINNSRFPLYHRLDLGLNYLKKTKRGNDATWSFGAYNVYNRKNPAYLDVSLIPSESGGQPSYQVVPKAFIPIIPYIKYSWKF